MADGEDIFLDTYSSIVRYIQETISELIEEGLAENIEFRDIDRHAEEQVLENIDYILMRSYSGNQGYILSDWVFEVGATTFEDENGFRHRAIINKLNKKFRPLKTIPIYSHKNIYDKLGTLEWKEPTTIQPTMKYNTRAVQYLLVSAASTETKP